MLLCECDGELQGNLFSASNSVNMINVDALPSNAVYLEKRGGVDIREVDFSAFDSVVIGGESVCLPKHINSVLIPTVGSLCLTSEAALAVVLMCSCQPNNGFRFIGKNVWASPMPRKKDLFNGKRKYGISSVIDLSKSGNPLERSWCNDIGLKYFPYHADLSNSPIIDDAVRFAKSIFKKERILVHCYNGRDRTGSFVERWRDADPEQ